MSDATSLEKLQAELFPGEQLLWHGRPAQGIRFKLSDIWAAFFGLLFLGIVLVLTLMVFGCIPMPKDWTENSSLTQAKFACGFWIVILLPFALYLLGGGLWLVARMRRQLFYGVTNERILLLRDYPGARSLTSMRIRDIPHLSLIAEPNGDGSLIFAARPASAPKYASNYLVSFMLIPEVRKVYTLIRSIQRESPASQG